MVNFFSIDFFFFFRLGSINNKTNYSNISNIDSNGFCYYNLPKHDSCFSSHSSNFFKKKKENSGFHRFYGYLSNGEVLSIHRSFFSSCIKKIVQVIKNLERWVFLNEKDYPCLFLCFRLGQITVSCLRLRTNRHL
jgi:hypothetical protein